MSETRETALERKLNKVRGGLSEQAAKNGLIYGTVSLFATEPAKDAQSLDLARDLVRCWREYLALKAEPRHGTIAQAIDSVAREKELLTEARALLARGDAQ